MKYKFLIEFSGFSFIIRTRLRVFSLFARTKVLQKSQSLTLSGFKPCHCIIYVQQIRKAGTDAYIFAYVFAYRTDYCKSHLSET